jgi:hypothetical protein
MMRFEPVPEPENFGAECHQRGNTWLAKHPDHDGRPPAYWSAFESDLADGFRNLCAYTAMYVCPGTVDHYLCWKKHQNLAYEWTNYRYAAQWVNSSKGDLDDRVLDPFAVRDDWFEILLPSLQLVVTDAVPEDQRERAEFTIVRLRLRDDERVIRQRRAWYEAYLREGITLDELKKWAPVLARAIQRAAVGRHR